MTVLIFFVVIWVVVTVMAFRRKAGAVIALGGGFVAACLALIPIVVGGKYLDDKYGSNANQSAQHSPPAPATQGKGLGVSHDRLLAALGPYAPSLQPAPTTPDGRTRLLGRTQGGSVGILEISGKALSQAVEKATLNVVATQDDQQSGVNALLLGRYLHALFPEWTDRADWAVKVIQADSEASIEVEGKRITFMPTDVSGTKMLMFTAEAL